MKHRILTSFFSVSLSLAIVSSGVAVGQTPITPPTFTFPQGPAPAQLRITTLRQGRGRTVVAGNHLKVHYHGMLFTNHTVFDSSYTRGTPFEFSVGNHMVIPGWEDGVMGMRTGEIRLLVLPPAMAYGARGVPPRIPANSTLIFVVELLKIT